MSSIKAKIKKTATPYQFAKAMVGEPDHWTINQIKGFKDQGVEFDVDSFDDCWVSVATYDETYLFPSEYIELTVV